jgi:ribonuclease-3
LEDVFEALVGAMYLDGGLEPTEKFLQKHFRPLAQQVKEPPKDAKTSLQEWAQARGLPLPEYTILSAEGPDHAPVFTIEVSLMEHGAARATGASKRTAEQAAAAELLEQLK